MGAKQDPMIWQRSCFARGHRLLLILVGVVLLVLGRGSTPCLSHPGNITAAVAKVQPDGTFELRIRFDLLAYILSLPPNHISDAPMNDLLDGPPADLERGIAEAKERFRQGFHVGSGGQGIIDDLTFPSATEVLQSVKGQRMRLPAMGSVVVNGHLPPGTRTISFQFDEVLGPVVLSTEFPYQEPIAEPLDAGAFSTELPIPSAESVAQAAAASQKLLVPKASIPSPTPVVVPKVKAPLTAKTTTPKPPVPSTGKALATPPVATPAPSPTATPVSQITKPVIVVSPSPSAISPKTSPSPTASVVAIASSPKPVAVVPAPVVVHPAEVDPFAHWLKNFTRYIKMGYTHILPEGVDHILFVLGLFLLSTRMKTLVQQITAFTIAHSLTLALSLHGVVRLPASFVEPAIAASIAFVAIENLFTTEMKVWRPAVVFGFGLIHGLGFATTLQGLGLRHDNLLTPLVGFNIGVELGQLTVVAAAFLLLFRFRNHPDYRKFVIVPGSLAIAAIAIFWMFQRIFF